MTISSGDAKQGVQQNIQWGNCFHKPRQPDPVKPVVQRSPKQWPFLTGYRCSEVPLLFECEKRDSKIVVVVDRRSLFGGVVSSELTVLRYNRVLAFNSHKLSKMSNCTPNQISGYTTSPKKRSLNFEHFTPITLDHLKAHVTYNIFAHDIAIKRYFNNLTILSYEYLWPTMVSSENYKKYLASSFFKSLLRDIEI